MGYNNADLIFNSMDLNQEEPKTIYGEKVVRKQRSSILRAPRMKEFKSEASFSQEGADENINYVNAFSAKPLKRLSIDISSELEEDENYISSDS
jgi:hypothetical protein